MLLQLKETWFRMLKELVDCLTDFTKKHESFSSNNIESVKFYQTCLVVRSDVTKNELGSTTLYIL